ncbi:MAG: PAS domain S-box protein [Anaerolineales bacterium]
MNTLPPASPRRDEWRKTQRISLNHTLLKILLANLFLMTIYEMLKQQLFPHITIWQSHIVTIIFSSSVTTMIAFLVLRRWNLLYDRAIAELERRVAAETALHTSEQRYREQLHFLQSLIDSLPTPLFYKDTEGIYQGCNQKFAEMLGFSKEEIVGKTVYEISPPQQADKYYTMDNALFANPGAQVYEYTVVGSDGARSDVVFHKATYNRADGTLGGLVGVILDISAHKQTEEALSRRAAQLTLLSNVSSEIAALLHLEDIFHRITTLVQERFGYHHVGLFSVDHERGILEMRSRAGAFDHLFPPEHTITFGDGMVGWVGQHGQTLLANDVEAEPRYVNFYPDVLPTQSELSVPIRLGEHGDEEIVGVIDVQSPEPDAFDEIDVMVIETLADQVAVAIANARLYQDVQRELREREQAEAALRASEARYHTISDLISDIAYAFRVEENGSLSCEWMTGPFDQLNKINATQITIAEIEQWIHPADLPAFQKANQNLLAGEPQEIEIRLGNGDVEETWLYIRNHPVWDMTSQRVVRIIGAAQDITERKQMEQQILRTERLAAMGHITATLAHEIKNPLQAIRSNLELVRDFPLESDERTESLNLSYHEIERLTEITERILSFSRAGKLEQRPVKLPRRVRHILDLLRPSLQKNDITVQLDLPPDLPPVLGEAEQIEQVLLNLILNAIEAMRNGGVLGIDAQIKPNTVELNFSNDGPPILEKRLPHIFEPFFTTKPDGIGLGLFISHHIIGQHNGALRAENLPDEQGVVFTIELPRADIDVDQNAEREAVA